jgi:hypothetical protein
MSVVRAILRSLTAFTAHWPLIGADDLGQERPSAQPATTTAYGMKGMGEGGAAPPPAATAYAVHDALATLGVEINTTPLTPPQVVAAISRFGSPVRGR